MDEGTSSARLQSLLPLPLTSTQCAVCHDTQDAFGITPCSMPLTIDGHEPNCCFQCWVRHLTTSSSCPFCRAHVQRVMEVSAGQLSHRRDVYHATRTATYSVSQTIGAYQPVHVVTVNNEPQVIQIRVSAVDEQVSTPGTPLPCQRSHRPRRQHGHNLPRHVTTAMRQQEEAAKRQVYQQYAYLRQLQESVAALHDTGFQFCTLTIPQLLQCPVLIHEKGTCRSCRLPVHLHTQ